MRLLLDTHIFLWGFLQPERIPETITKKLEGAGSEIWLSPISIWECLVLSSKGRISLFPDPETWIRTTIRDLSPKEAPITHEVAFRSRSIDLPHEDLADRFLAATAVVFDLILVTVDERFKEAKGFRILTG